MASPREIEDFRKDPAKWRFLMRQLVKYDRPALSDEILDFIERVLPLEWLEEISYRQAEWLLDIRDRVRIVSAYRQFSLRALLKVCYENRFDFDEADQEWLETLFQSGLSEFRLYEARRLYRLAHVLGEVDSGEAA